MESKMYLADCAPGFASNRVRKTSVVKAIEPRTTPTTTMAYNIEKVAKETILLFFLETTEPHLAKFDDRELTQISRWLSKITRLDLYSMRTHLLLLYHVLKRGRLLPPFDKDPATVHLPRFRGFNSYIDVEDPNLDRVLSSVTRCAADATRHAGSGGGGGQARPEQRDRLKLTGRQSRKDVFHIPCRRPVLRQQHQQQQQQQQLQQQCASDINRTYTVARSRSQPPYQGDYDDDPCVSSGGGNVVVDEKRSRSVPRTDSPVDENYRVQDQQRTRAGTAADCCPLRYNIEVGDDDDDAGTCTRTVCRPAGCASMAEPREIRPTSTFRDDNHRHLPDFPVSPIRRPPASASVAGAGPPISRFWTLREEADDADVENRNVASAAAASQRSRIPVPKTRFGASQNARQNESRVSMTNSRFAPSSRFQSGVTVFIVSPVRRLTDGGGASVGGPSSGKSNSVTDD